MKRIIMPTLVSLVVAAGCSTRATFPDRPLRELVAISHATGPLPADLSKNDRAIVASMRASAAKIAEEKKSTGR